MNTTAKQLINATKEFSKENRKLSIYYTASSFTLLFVTLTAAMLVPMWPLQLMLAVISGFFMLRCFVLFHDFLHGSILRGSAWANVLFTCFSVLSLTPKNVWKETHNYHHAHNAKIATSHIGSYHIVTTIMWKKMSRREKMYYAFSRHPLTMLFGIFSVFLIGMCIAPIKRNIKKNWGALIILIIYFLMAIAIVHFLEVRAYLFGILIPQIISGTIGAYLFYAQHNFPDVDIRPNNDWTFLHSSLKSSSYMEMSPLMHWFSANIGYHHIHHLNPKIPFYYLPDAMRKIPELQNAKKTSLRLRDIKKCLQLKVWDVEQQKMIAYPTSIFA